MGCLLAATGQLGDKGRLLQPFPSPNIKLCNVTRSLKPNIREDTQKLPGYQIS